MAELGDDSFIVQRRCDVGTVHAGSQERVAGAYHPLFYKFPGARWAGACGGWVDIGEYPAANSGYFTAVVSAIVVIHAMKLFTLSGRTI